MTDLLDERRIRARFDAVSNQIDDSDWSEVLRMLDNGNESRETDATGLRRVRVGANRRLRLRFALAAVVVLTVAAAGTGFAFGWPQDFVNFLTAPSAPK